MYTRRTQRCRSLCKKYKVLDTNSNLIKYIYSILVDISVHCYMFYIYYFDYLERFKQAQILSTEHDLWVFHAMPQSSYGNAQRFNRYVLLIYVAGQATCYCYKPLTDLVRPLYFYALFVHQEIR